MPIPITAMYTARFHIVYNQPSTREHWERLNEVIRESALPFELDDENTRWFIHSKAVTGAYAGADREQVERAAARLEARLARMRIAKLVTEDEWIEMHPESTAARTKK